MKNKSILLFFAGLLFLFLLSLQFVAFAQSPHKMSFQSVIRNSSGTLVVNANVGVKLSVLQWTATGTTVYAERHTAWTNANGLVSLEMGTGATVIGTFSALDWTNGPYFLKVEVDPTGGTSYTISSTTQLLSVPYAMYAAKAGSVEVTPPNFWTFSTPNLYNNVGTYVGIGTPTPTYALSVKHGGSTGIGVASTAGFSTVDIDAQTGDAALRFAKAGVNQWNIRNRPADDYLEFFELGGGGSRMVIQDATGNVGIGETTSPSYKLDVLHGGSTGLRVKSSSSFSTIDIDANSGDAALRFVKNGVNQWNIRNRPADDYFEIFELGGGGSRLVIQDATGNVGIGETTSPSYKLDVLHGGATGLRVKSSASFSTIDIDANSGDAALRFVKNGVNQWNVRNDPANDNLQFFELGGGGERMRIDNTTGKVWVLGAFTALGAKAFTIDHPLDPENKFLAHAAAESNEVINFYSGNVVTDANGLATVKLPDYFEAINKDFRYQLTVIGAFAQAIISREVRNNEFEISTSIPNVKVSWEVKGVRNDAYMKKNPFVAEENKTAAQRGKYIDPASHNLPDNRGISYDAAMEGKSSTNYLAPAITKKAVPDTGGSLDQRKSDQTKIIGTETKGTSIDEPDVKSNNAGTKQPDFKTE